jgi:hypothetical protein
MRTAIFAMIVLFAAAGPQLNAQVLHTESFNLILDSTKVVKGSFMPSFRYRNVQKEYIEIENTADITFRFNNNAFTFANKLEYAIYGKENLMSGGFVYFEYRNLQSKIIAIEPFAQIHWQEIRGLELKYAGGAHARWRIIVKPDLGFFAGFGALYEHERWNYSGVQDPTLIPPDSEPVKVNIFRGSSYLSLKKKFGEMFDLDLSVYYQPALGEQSISHRLATSSALTYNISQHFGLTLVYQNIYDSSPVVPVQKLFNDINLGITISF